MKYLLDVNILVGWGWSDHVDHLRVARWIAGIKKSRADLLMTSPIPQLGFVRVSMQRTGGRITVHEASETLSGMIHSLGNSHEFLADDQPVQELPEWCQTASRTTDAHLYSLAAQHGAQLATLDRAIPAAFQIPELE